MTIDKVATVKLDWKESDWIADGLIRLLKSRLECECQDCKTIGGVNEMSDMLSMAYQFSKVNTHWMIDHKMFNEQILEKRRALDNQ